MKFCCLLVSRTNNESPCGIVFGFNVTSYALTRTVLQLACMSDQPTHPFQTTKYYGSHAFFFFFSLNAYAHSDGAAAATRHLYTTDVEQFMGVRFCFRSVPVVVLRACVSTYYKFVIRPAKPTNKKINVFWFECSVVEGQWTGWMKVKLGKVVLLDAEIQASGSMWYLIG